MQACRRTVLAGLALMVGRQAHAACGASVSEPAGVPMEVFGLCVVGVSLAGQEVRMVLDTGAERTVLTRAAVARLGLSLDEWVGTTLRGAGGRLDEHRNAIVRSLALGGTTLYQRVAGEALSLPVMALDLGPIVGLLGGDMLWRHTLDLNAPAGRFSLRDDQSCLPFDAEPLPLHLLRRSSMLVRVILDGHDLLALIDTGAAGSLINARGLYKLGLTQDTIVRDPVVTAIGLGGSFTAHRHTFGALRFGRREISSPRLLVNTVPEPAFDLVLGMDVLGQQRMILSYARQRLYLAV